ncbi:MAG: ATP-binding protein [Hydrogenophaga sp.]|uniref:ATP-binding protein n=1 Tax=Hydrogenophaga sp. TaxID=1904254 RepID=UPI002621495E|nr:ATP-binding protein [Hydrogenophaga sp.]MDM7943185.1 ATP-binding protein [Hydrogenophaga sp.]
MKLQHKAWGLILAAVAVCAAGALVGVRHIVLDSFSQLEVEHAAREGERARRVFNQQVQALSATTQDYAYWSDAVDYVQGRQASFLSDNFDADNMGYLRISEVLVIDGQARVIGSLTRDDALQLSALEVGRIASLRELALPVLKGEDPKTVLQTLRVVEGNLEIVIAAAVRDPDVMDGAVQGVMVAVRRFDEVEVLSLAEVLMMPARLNFSEPGRDGQAFYVLPVNAERADLHAVLQDHRGRPVAELVLGLDRRLQAQGQAMTWQGMIAVALTALMASLLLVLLLDRFLLKRLQRICSDIDVIARDGPTAAPPVLVQGNDEISSLACGINQLLQRVQADALQQRLSFERQEAIQAQLMQSQKSEALGRLAGGIAHDINNSLAAVTGWVRLTMEDLEEKHPGHESLGQALKATKYADGLIRQLLAFGRKTAPRLQRLHLATLVEDTRRLVSAGLTRECEIVAIQRVDSDLVEGDPTQLQQVLVNLLINAADAMDGKGRIEITIDALTLPQPDGHPPELVRLGPGRFLSIEVRDFGPGMAPELIDRVFEPFFTTKSVGRGTGLGLSVAQGITSHHGGHIGLSSVPGDGTRFCVYLPAREDTEATSLPASMPSPDRHRRELLFVDDDQLVRQSWSALLERRGWQVTRARDGEEAWSYLVQSARRWDVVLTDLSMPRLDGVGLGRRIRSMERPPPVVLLSGNLGEADARQIETLFAAVLRKPVEAGELDRVLHEVVQRAAGAPDPA